MERIQRIIQHPLYQECLEKTAAWEREREFCRHDTNHFLNVARIAMILNLQEKLQVGQEILYAAALLHDIGRYLQYENGTDHALVSSEIAPEILKESDFGEKEASVIISAIKSHRQAASAAEPNVTGLLYRADKLSRDCYFCPVREKCDRKEELKNYKLCL